MPASRGLYAQGTNVTVTAGENSDHVFLGWTETGNGFNPTLAKMDKAVTLTASFREKTTGEQIQETVIDPALNALGVAAKKAVGGIAYVTKIFAQHVIDDVFLKTLSSIGDGLKAGFGAIGVEGKVLDGIVLGLQTPSNAFEASMAGFDCVEEWAWGRSVPTLDDVKDTVTAAARGAAKTTVKGVEVDDVVDQALALQAKIEAGDPEALAGAYIASTTGGGARPRLLPGARHAGQPGRVGGTGHRRPATRWSTGPPRTSRRSSASPSPGRARPPRRGPAAATPSSAAWPRTAATWPTRASRTELAVGVGPGVGRAAVEALGLLHHHRGHGAGRGASLVAVPEGMADLVADHVVAVVLEGEVALRRPLRASASG